ncbi:UDP-3-O-(3-hydroxymyristoyl)glucosamine N-acyltransferase [Aliidiomarina quisquiliarum]|uniref:UDP-3-O-(3-hydroxymyristoyl)glucosamine N-acyltransferase n=1 Tax=Aliidiomarina quisquiliarum TaxID=2938947 RepID=UPI00208EAE93|nr:UDP-3-O-(3-hydroxymyristoyl)glucosamine N-acyltransferase [Aliidiomarina quisquiliarum]MCO4320453.1 UDP-3-O-(3-hydroxymyristoyl)glucosamine N-acyltransferase [Aliidiomarina quisquiliarum]
MKTYTLAELAQLIGAEVQGDASYQVTGLATLAKASATEVAFLANPKYLAQLNDTAAGSVILHPKVAAETITKAHFLISSNPYLSYAKAAQAFNNAPTPTAGVHPSAVIHPTAQLGADVSVGAQAVISAGAKIGANTVIGAQSFVGENVTIGENCQLWSQVSVYYHVSIGNHCSFHSGVVIGSDGFGWASENGKWVKIPQLGSVCIGDHVEIGANTVIDRGALDDTIIESGCIIDNLCQIAHNVVIGEHTAIAGQVGIAGSTVIGKNCMIGGQAGIGGHLTICDGVQFHGMSMVTKSVTKPGVYASGVPVMEQGPWAKSGVRFRQLPELFNRVRALEKKLLPE